VEVIVDPAAPSDEEADWREQNEPSAEWELASPGPKGGLRGRARQRVQRAPLSAPVRSVIWVLGAIGGLAAWLLLYAFVLSGFQEASAQHALYATLRTDLAQGTAKLGGRIALGTPVALLEVPEAGVNDVVQEGTTAGVLEQGPGLEADTPLPGQAGVSVIYGRQALFGGPFRHLSALRAGDVLAVTTGAGTFDYKVIDLRYPRDPYPPLLAPGQGRLTLVTTTGPGWPGLGQHDEFLYVDADLISKAVSTPSGQPTAIPVNQQPMHGDKSVLFVLVLWLQLLVSILVLTVWAGYRWAIWQTWLVATPAVLAILWVVSEVAFQLLPNLL
jgi:sortase A